jgi:hypothetical protein
MKNFKTTIKAILTIGERLLLTLVGLSAGYASTLNLTHSDLKTVCAVLAVLCLIFGLTPMITSYVKAVWPKK